MKKKEEWMRVDVYYPSSIAKIQERDDVVTPGWDVSYMAFAKVKDRLRRIL
jgi:hypothetical protein